jgi:hypothetical protein
MNNFFLQNGRSLLLIRTISALGLGTDPVGEVEDLVQFQPRTAEVSWRPD